MTMAVIVASDDMEIKAPRDMQPTNYLIQIGRPKVFEDICGAGQINIGKILMNDIGHDDFDI